MKNEIVLVRLLDIALSLCAIVLLSPVMLTIAAIIWLSDRGPVLFRQTRVGRGRQTFEILKFRTMFASDSRDGSSQGTVDNIDVATARRKFRPTVKNDPRITPVGRLLRPSHLDELPQLLNVLRGDMSLVGVRPDTPSQEADYEPAYWVERHRLRPGITGPAQIRPAEGGLSARTSHERLWLQSPNLRDYLVILAHTVRKVVDRSSY